MYRISFKRTLSLLLCLLMLMSLLPMGAFATDAETPAEPPAAETPAEPQQPPVVEQPEAPAQEQPQTVTQPAPAAEQPEAPAEEPLEPLEPAACEHTGGEATCTAQAKCATCGAAYGELAAHSFAEGKCANCGAADPDYKAPCEHSYGEDGNCTLCGEAKPAEPQPDAEPTTDTDSETEPKPDAVLKTGAALKTTAPRLTSAAITTPITVNIGTFDDKKYDGNNVYPLMGKVELTYTEKVDGQELVITINNIYTTYGHFADANVGSPKTFTISSDQYTAKLGGQTIEPSSINLIGVAGIKGNTLTASGSGTASGAYGDALSAFNITATPTVSYEGTEIPGTWAPVDGEAKPAPGTSTWQFKFTPNENASNYVPLTKSFSVTAVFDNEKSPDVKYPLTYTGFTVKDKEFDNSNVVQLDLTNHRLEGLPSGFEAWMPATASGTLESADAGTHNLTAVDAVIWIYDLSTNVEVTDKFDISMDTTGITGTIKPLEIHHDGFIASPKSYNGSTAMSFDFDGGNIEHNTFTISVNNYTGTYDTADAGDNKTFTVAPDNYTVNGGSIASANFILTGTGSITPAGLSMDYGSSISGEYGDKLSELDFSGLTCIYGLNTVVPGTWTIAEEQEDITLYTLGKTDKTFGFIFTPESPNYSSKTILYSVTIHPRKVDVSIVGNTETVTYDGKEHSISGYTLSYDDAVLKDEYIEFSGTLGTASGKNAGTYTAAERLSAEDFSCNSGNFDLSFTVANQTSLTISKAPLTITANDLFYDEIYEDYDKINWEERYSCRYEGFVNGENESVLTAKPTFSASPIDLEWHLSTVPIYISGAEAANYEITHVNGTLTEIVHSHKDTFETDGLSIIATCYNDDGYCFKPVRRVTLSAVDVDYTGEPANAVTVEKDTGIGGVNTRYTGTDYDGTVAPTDVGHYTVTLTVDDATTNNSASVSTQFSILPKDITKCTVSFGSNSFTYSGSAPDMNISVVDNSVGSKTLTAGVDYELGAMQKDVGEYTVTVKGIGNYTGEKEIPYEIKKATSSIAFKDFNPSWTYTGEELANPMESQLEISGASYSDVTFKWYKDGEPIPGRPIDAGTYKVVASIPESQNTSASSATMEQIHIKPLSMTGDIITLVNKRHVYDGTEKTPAVTVKFGDITVPASEYTVSYSKNINAGTATVTITDKEGGNYEFGTASKDFTIEKAFPEYTEPSGLTATYGDKLKNVKLPEGWAWDEPDASVGNVGSNSFNVQFIPEDKDNYYTLGQGLSISVSPKTLTISSITANDKVYDGTTAIELKEVQFNGLVDAETVSIDTESYTATAAKADAGENIEVTVTGLKLTGDAAKNYTLSQTGGSTTVKIKPKIVTPDVTLSATEFTYNGKEHKPTVVLKDGETVIPASEYRLSYAENINAGKAKVQIIDVDGNYKFGPVEKDFTINKAKLTAAPQALSLTRGSAAPSLKLLVSGLISGDEKTVTIAPAAVLKLYDSAGKEISPAEAVKAVGTYTIKWENMDSVVFGGIDNYELSKTQTAKLEVKAPPASATTSANSGAYYYTAAPVTPTVTVPISGDEKTINVKATVKGGTATIDDVSAAELNKVIGDDVKTGTVTIDFTRLNTRQTITRVEIPADSVKAITEAVHDEENDAESLEIILGSGRSIEFDAAALAEKVEQAKGEDITISIIHTDYVPTLTEAQRDVLGNKDAYDINVYSGGKHISDMGGKITVHVPYVLKPGEDAEGIRVYYVDENGGRELCQSSYDKAKKRVNFITDHLSLYMIEYEAQPLPAEQAEAAQSGELSAGTVQPDTPAEDAGAEQSAKLLPWILLLILSMLGVAFGAFMLLRKRK